jgi:hypothetical protein
VQVGYVRIIDEPWKYKLAQIEIFKCGGDTKIYSKEKQGLEDQFHLTGIPDVIFCVDENEKRKKISGDKDKPGRRKFRIGRTKTGSNHGNKTDHYKHKHHDLDGIVFSKTDFSRKWPGCQEDQYQNEQKPFNGDIKNAGKTYYEKIWSQNRTGDHP